MSKAARHEALINVAADAVGVPRQVAQALADTEDASRNEYGRGDAGRWGGGSYGLFRITLATAKGLGYTGPVEGLYDPSVNARLGLTYLLQMFRTVGAGSWPRAYAAYNAGPDLSPWPAENVERFAGNLKRWAGKYGPLGDAPRPVDGGRAPGGGPDRVAVATAAEREAETMKANGPTGPGPIKETWKRTGKRLVRGLLYGALAAWAAKHGIALPVPDVGGALDAGTIGTAVNVALTIGADKLARELRARRGK